MATVFVMGRLYPFLVLLALLPDPAQCTDNVKRTCASINVNDGLIIDIKASVAYGAKVLGGAYVESNEACTSSCCSKEECDLALYKKDGRSSSGKNCYHMQCGVLANCKMVKHEGFVSVVMAKYEQPIHGSCVCVCVGWGGGGGRAICLQC